MPITQDRVKRLLDAGLAREHDFTSLHNAISYIYIKATKGEYPDLDSLLRELLVELHMTKSLLRPDATLALEENKYHYTHAINTRRKENMRQLRDNLRTIGLLNTKPRNTEQILQPRTIEQIELDRDNASEFIPTEADLLEMVNSKAPQKPLIDAEEDARLGAEREANDPEYAKIMQEIRESRRRRGEP